MMAAMTAEASEPARHLVGATENPVRLVGQTVRAPVTIDQRATRQLQIAPGQIAPARRTFLDVEDIEAERDPGKVYCVYVNLPEQPTEIQLNAHHVGNISLFGVERARNPRGDEHGHGLRVSMEITPVLDRLAAEGSWREGTTLEVTFRPITLEMPSGATGAAMTAAQTAHPDLPITIGRVSVHFA
jgi:tyrosinase